MKLDNRGMVVVVALAGWLLVVISASVSSGSLTDGSTLIFTEARKVFGSRAVPSTEPTLMPLMRTSLPS